MTEHIPYPEEVRARAIAKEVKRVCFICSICGACVPLQKTMPYPDQPTGYRCVGECPGCGAEIEDESRNHYLPN